MNQFDKKTSGLRLWKQEDIPQIALLEALCFADAWSKTLLEREWDNPVAHYVVWEEEGGVQAYAGTWLIVDEAHITNLAVHPHSRRKGIAKQMMLGLMQVAKQTNHSQGMTLEVRASNDAALFLYESLDFVVVGRRARYYQDGEDALIMWNYDIAATMQIQRP